MDVCLDEAAVRKGCFDPYAHVLQGEWTSMLAGEPWKMQRSRGESAWLHEVRVGRAGAAQRTIDAFLIT